MVAEAITFLEAKIRNKNNLQYYKTFMIIVKLYQVLYCLKLP
jgi:hypothetical protein